MSFENVSYSTEPSSGPTNNRHNRLIVAVIICGAISTLISAYLLLHSTSQPSLNMVVGVDFGSGSGDYTFVTATKTGKPSLIPYLLQTADKKTFRVIDTVRTEEQTFYLLQEDASTVNVFQKGKDGLIKITNTPSLKRNLSYDGASHTLAYETATHASPSSVPWEIKLFSLKDSAELSTPYMGLQSQLVAGGAGLFVTSSSSVEYASLSSNERKPVAQSITPQRTLLSEDGTSVLVFDPIARTINTYARKPIIGVSFVGASKKLSFDPLAIAQLGTDTYIVFQDRSVPASGFELQNLTTGVRTPLLVPRNAVITSVTYE